MNLINTFLNMQVLADSLPQLLWGLLVTLQIGVTSIVCGLAAGLFLAVASDKPLTNLDFEIKEMTSPTFFRLLEQESKATNASPDIALVAFDLKPPAAAVSTRD
jgi:hypothetical protein